MNFTKPKNVGRKTFSSEARDRVYYNALMSGINEIDTLEKSAASYSNKWLDSVGQNTYLGIKENYYKKVNDIKSQLEASSDLYKRVMGEEQYNNLYANIKNESSNQAKDMANTENLFNLYSKFNDERDFKNAVFSNKHSNITSLGDYDKYTKTHDVSKLDKDEQEWLTGYSFALKYWDLENAIEATQSQINELSKFQSVGRTPPTQDGMKKSLEEFKSETSKENEKKIKGLKAHLKNLENQKESLKQEGGKYSNFLSTIEGNKLQHNFKEKWSQYSKELEEIEKKQGNSDKEVKLNRNAMAFDANKEIAKGDFDTYSYMENDEKKLYNYILAKYGLEKAEEYLSDLVDVSLDQRLNLDWAKRAQEYSDKHPVTGFLGQQLMNAVSGVEFAANVALGNDYKRSRAASLNSGLNEGIRDNFNTETGRFLYDTVTSGVQSAGAAMLGPVGEFVLGGGAAASQYNDLLDRGATKGRALAGAFAAGAAETLFEHLSLGQLRAFQNTEGIFKGLTKTQAKKELAKMMGKSAFVNWSEEELTELSNMLTDDAFQGELSNYAISVEKYYKSGLTLDEAKAKATKDMAKNFGLAGLSGGIIGLFFGAGGNVKNYSVYQKANRYTGKIISSDTTNIEKLKNVALTSDSKDIVNAAKKLSQKSSASNVGAVYNSLQEYAMEQTKKQLEEALIKNGATKSGSNSAKGWAAQIIKSAIAPKDGNGVMQEAMLRTNSITGNVYSAFVDEGKYGGDTILALNELVTPAKTQTTAEGDSANGMGNGATVINNQGVEVPVTEDGQPAAGPVGTGALRGLVSGEVRDFATVPRSGNLRGIATAPRSGNIRSITDAYGERVRQNLNKITPKIEKTITKIGESFGLNVEFVDEIANGADGEITGNNIKISRYAQNPVKFIFKHELTHSFESSKLYNRFSKYVFEESVAFKHWLKTNSYETSAEAIKETMDRYTAYGEELSYTDAKKEVIADFVGDMLFNNGKGLSNSTIDEDFLSELAKKDRNLFERFVEWVESIIARFNDRNAVDRDIIKLEQKLKRLKETVGTSKVDSVTKKSYNQFRTEAMIWANSFKTNVGDTKIFNRNGAGFVLLESTEDGYIEIASGNYKELKTLEQQYRKPDNSVYVYSDIVRNAKRGRIADNGIVKNSGKYERSSRSIGSEGLQTDTAGNNEHLQSSNKEISNAKADSVDGSASSMHKKQYSYAGQRASTANLMQLDTAKDWLKKGIDSETIRKETGWFKGMDGKWRFEISDKEADINFKNILNDILAFWDFSDLKTQFAQGTISAEEYTNKTIEAMDADWNKRTLKDYFKHEKLFEAYPELAEISIQFNTLNGKATGAYDPALNCIWLEPRVIKSPDAYDVLIRSLIHETQHAIQYIEGFTKGASGVYWKAMAKEGKPARYKNGEEMPFETAYRNTAGEIEAYDASRRRLLDDDERKNIRPDIDREDVVFADEELKELAPFGTENMQYSIPGDHNYVYTDGKASFTEERLNNLFDEHSLGDGKRAEHSNAYVAYVSPEDFINLTSNENIRGRVEDEAYILNEEELKNESETPFIEYDPATGEVVNHEGRHRMVALKADGIKNVAVVIKPSTDSFERREAQDISLTGQNFAGGKASGNVTVKNAIPLSEKYRTEATAQFAKNPDADVRYSIPSNKKITPNMSESDRADILSNAKIDIVDYIEPQGGGIDFKYLENSIKSKAEKHLLKKLQSLGYLKHYTTKAVDVEFDFTMGGLRKSTHSQLEYGGNYSDFAKVVVNLQGLLDSSMLIESHTDKAKGTLRENPQLKQVYVLLSALNDGKNIIPVQFEIKQFVDDNNRLYLAVALTKIETGVMGNTIPNNSQVSTNLLPISNISIPELFSKINPKDKKFLKYVPDEFLNKEQKAAKQEALKEDAVKYGRKNTQHSFPDKAKGKTFTELKAMVDNGEITSDEALEALADEYGEMPKGENPKVDVTLPEKISETKNVRQFVRNVVESGHLADDMTEREKREVINGALTYEVISDKSAMESAQKKIAEDVESAVREWDDMINSGKRMTKHDIALGEQLLIQAAESGNANDVMKYVAEIAELGTQLGQDIQALRLLKQMSGMGQLYYVTRMVAKLNKDIESKYGKEHKIVEIDPDLASILAGSTNQSEIDAVVEDLIKDVASQIKSSWADKFNSWRYLSMLGNPRTHIRNMIGNAVFVPAVGVKNKIAALAERAFIKQENRTKVLGLLKAEYRDFAKADFEKIQDILKGGGKMNPTDKIREQMKVYDSKAFAWLESLRKLNFDLLEKEDGIFLKGHYIRALGGALQARGLDINNLSAKQLEELRTYAIKEAQKATYRDVSGFANALSNLRNGDSALHKIGATAVEGLLPFKKTPINILKRGMEYSPIGIVTSLAEGIKGIRNGSFSGAQLIDGLSAGLTGTGIMLLGALFYSLGFIKGGLGYDDEEALERLSGKQPYSIEIGGVSYTIDWMAPAILPFMIGAEISKASEEGENGEAFNFFDAITAIGAPMTELSMLSGLNDAIETLSYSDSKITDFTTNLFASYFSQYVPTLFGQVARTFDDTRRTNFVDKNSNVPRGLQTAWQKAIGKIPGLANTKVPYIDAWGRSDVDENIIGRAFSNFASPGYISTIEDDAVNNELAKVYVDTGEKSVLPKRASTSIQVSGETVNLTADEYLQYAIDKGQYSRQYIESLMNHPMYSGMDSASKAAAISDLYSYANAKAKSNVSDYDYTDSSTYRTVAKLEAVGIDPASYYIAKQATSTENADTDGSGTVTKKEKQTALKNAGFSSREISTILDINKK